MTNKKKKTSKKIPLNSFFKGSEIKKQPLNSDGIFKTIFETTPDGIILINSETLNIEAINPALLHMLGDHANELRGKSFLELSIFNETNFCKDLINELKQKSSIRYENCLINKDYAPGLKLKIYAEVIAHIFEFNNTHYIKLHIRDDTQRRQMEENLRLSELSLREAQHQARIGSWIWNPKTDEAVWSEEMYHIFGLDPNSTPANFKEVSKFYTPESWGRLRPAVENTLETGAPFELDLEIIKKDGIQIWATCRVEASRDVESKIIGLRGSVQDINDRKEADKKDAETKILKHADKMKSIFLANMSHELRSPLNSIIGFSEMLKDGLLGDLTERQIKYIGNIYYSGEHLLSLINDILDLSKVESGKMTLDLEPIDISSLLTNSIGMFTEKALKHRITFLTDIFQNIGAFLADNRKVKQIIYNLLSNAIKFTNDGGNITLIARPAHREDIGQLSGTMPGRNFNLPENEFREFLEISVLDEGTGIPFNALGQLFQSFSQVDNGLARKFEGTGLGLALVKQMAELHGGTVRVESSAGLGSKFTVWLPLRPYVENPMVSLGNMILPEFKKADDGKPTVLVIEDDDQAAQLILFQLEKENLRTLHVKSAEAALELLQEITPDLITLDILLPGMDGWEFLGRIKQMAGLSKTPVVIISMVPNEHKGIALGASAVLQKPIGRNVLQSTLATIGFQGHEREHPYKILIVDDDPDAVEILAGHLNIPGFQVIRTYGGQQAIEEAHRTKPDLILLDLVMPKVSGFDVVEDLKEHSDTMNIPIVIVTASLITNKERKVLNIHGINIMGKSKFNQDLFVNEVRRVLLIDQDIK